MKNKLVVLFAFFILTCLAATSPADVVELNNGDVVEGEITEESKEFVAIETDEGISFLKREEIKSVKKIQLEAATGSFAEVTGNVEVRPAGEEKWLLLQEGATLNEGDSVRTGIDSSAIAVIEDQVIVAVEPQSALDVDKLQRSSRKELNMKVSLGRGQIWNDAGKLKSRSSKFYVSTPAAVTGVRGTTFTVKAGPEEKTTVACVEGEVGVRTRDMAMDPVRIEENQMTEVTPNKPPTAPTTISAAFLAQWAVYQAKFGLLHSGMGAGLQVTPGQAALGGGVAAGAVAAAAAAGTGGGGSSGANSVTVSASQSGNYSPFPIEIEIDGSPEIGTRTVTGVDVTVQCDPLTIPDQFQIKYMGNVIADTGPISSLTTLTGSANGDSSSVFIVVVTGPLGTDWHWDADVTFRLE